MLVSSKSYPTPTNLLILSAFSAAIWFVPEVKIGILNCFSHLSMISRSPLYPRSMNGGVPAACMRSTWSSASSAIPFFIRRERCPELLDFAMPDVIKERDDANPVRQHPDHFYKRSRTLRWFDYTDHATPRIGRHYTSSFS